MPVVDRDLFADVREMLVQVLAVDESEVRRESRFFDDLAGESIDVLELSFLAEKRYGIPIRFEAMFKPTAVAGASPALGEAALADLRTRLDFIDWSSLPATPSIDDLKSIFTVDTIVRLLEQKLAGRADATSPSVAQPPRL